MRKPTFNHMLALATTMTMVAGSQVVYAQQNTKSAEKEVEEVVVTGFRSSILNSVEAKRNADQVVEVIDAGDLGSLPDVSIADALGRMPGVTTVRDSGQSSQLNIRGMNGDFVQTSLNGREQASTSGYTAGSRWISFDQYPSELITQAAIYKSPKASLIEGGVAGTVELKTANPLEAKNQHNFQANVRGSFNDAASNVGADEYGSRVSFSYQGKFADDTLGVGLGYARLDQPNNAEEAITFPYGSPRDVDGDGTAERVMNGFQFRAGSGTDTRNGLMGTLVFEPSENLNFQFDYFKSDFESQDEKYGLTLEGLHRNANTYSLTDATVENGFVVGGTVLQSGLVGPWTEMRSEDQSTESDSESFGLKTEWQINDKASMVFDIARSTGDKSRMDRIATVHAYEYGTGTLTDGTVVQTWKEKTGQGYTFMNNAGKGPAIDFTTDYTDLSYMRLSEWEQFPHKYTDELDSAKLDFKYDVEAAGIASIEAGFRWSDRTFTDDRGTFRYGQREGQSRQVINGAIVDQSCEFNTSGVPCTPHEIDGFVTVENFGGSLAQYGSYLKLDMVGIANEIFGNPDVYAAKKTWNHNWTLIESGAVEEEVFAYYLMANLDTEIGGIPVTGNVGVRVVETDTKSIGIQQVRAGEGDAIADDDGVVRNDYKHIKYGPEYRDVLPSINLNFAITDTDQVRFAAAQVMGRPPVYQLRGGAGSWIDIANDGVSPRYNVWSKGNPNLDPFRADQFDLSYEHYFDNGGAATVAVFYKDIESLIESITYNEGEIAWSEIGIEAPAGTVEGQYQTVRNNDQGGYIRGLELAYTQTFDQLPGVFSGLGLTASYAFTESETSVDGGQNFEDLSLPLPGLSENVWSTTLFWDIGSFSANVNARYRDEYTYAGATPGGTSFQIADAYTVVDAQVSYAFDNGVDLYLQVNNLTDEPNTSNYGTDNAVGEVKYFGRQYFFGVGYKF